MPGSTRDGTLTKQTLQVASRHSPTNGKTETKKANKARAIEAIRMSEKQIKTEKLLHECEQQRSYLASSINEYNDRIAEIERLKMRV